MYKKDYRAAENTFRRTLSLDSKNKRVRYYLARNFLHKKDYANAENEMRIYLDMKIDPIQRGWANHYLGHILRRQKRYEDAHKAFGKAYSLTRNKRSKKWLGKMKKRIQ